MIVTVYSVAKSVFLMKVNLFWDVYTWYYQNVYECLSAMFSIAQFGI